MSFCEWCRVWVTRLWLGSGRTVWAGLRATSLEGWGVLLRVVSCRTVVEGLPAMSPWALVGLGGR